MKKKTECYTTPYNLYGVFLGIMFYILLVSFMVEMGINLWNMLEPNWYENATAYVKSLRKMIFIFLKLISNEQEKTFVWFLFLQKCLLGIKNLWEDIFYPKKIIFPASKKVKIIFIISPFKSNIPKKRCHVCISKQLKL